MKKLSLVLVLAFVLAFATPVSAGIEPSPFIIGKLDSISSSMSVINQRIDDAFTRMGVGPSPFIPFINQLGAIDNQLNHLHDRIVDVSMTIEEQGVDAVPEVITAMSNVLVGAQTIALNLQSISRNIDGTAPEDLQLILAQTATSADSITEIFNPYNPGLAAPTGLTAKDYGYFLLEVAWNAVSDATGYAVQRSLSSTGPWEDIDTEVTDTHLWVESAPLDYYFYRVRAFKPFGSTLWYSAWTDPVGGTKNDQVIPGNFRATSMSNSITVSWDHTIEGVEYQVCVYHSPDGSSFLNSYTFQNTVIITYNIVPDTDYYVDVRSAVVGTVGWNDPTPALYIKTKAP